ncbi:MAG: hypothetical protein H6563_02410 [Lewinellaceae bacterium]|nr:hypothetical protein [Lewinellaceae bacterium]
MPLKKTVAGLCLACFGHFYFPAAYGQNFTFDHLTINQELSNNTIYSITEDRDGFMWFGSRDGLNKYDGYEFTIYKSNPADSLSLPGNNIQSLFNHPNGDLWIGLRAGGLCILDRATQQFRVNPFAGKVFPDWRSVSVQAIFQDSRGYIWIGTAAQGVVRIDPKGEQWDYFGILNTPPNRQLQNNACFSFVEDKAHNIWMGTAGDHLHCYLRQQDSIMVVGGKPEAGFDLYSYAKYLLLKDDILWIGTEGNGVLLYDPEKEEFLRKGLGKSLVKDVVRYRNIVLVSTDGAGLYYTEDDGKTFQSVQYTTRIVNSLNTNALYDIFVDSNQNIWIGSFNGGVNVYIPDKTEFLSYAQEPTTTDAPGSQSALAFQEDEDGYIWIGKDGGGLLRFNPDDQSYVIYRSDPEDPHSISSNVVTSIFEDNKGRLWVGTFSFGLNLFDRKTGKFEHFQYDPSNPASLSNNNVWSIVEDHSGNLWIGTLGGGLNRLDEEKKRFYRYMPDTQAPFRSGKLSDWNVRVLLVDEQDNLWIGTEFGGLNRRDPKTGQFEFWLADTRDSTRLQSNFILCLHQDRKGRLWVGTEGGGLHLMQPDRKSFRHYGIEDGLPSNVINAIEEDHNGILWISTNNGLASFDPHSGQIVAFDKYDGLQSNQFNPGASIHRRNGEIYFGGVFGINSFLPGSVQIDTIPPKVVITGFKLFNQPVPVGPYKGRTILPGPLNERPVIRLRYFDNVFTIEFAALDFKNPSKCHYAYRLDGFEEKWTQVDSKHRLATYTNLDAGTYSFLVKAANNSGAWSDPVRLSIVITPPFWRTLWFRLIITLLIAGTIIFLLTYLDGKRREAHQKELLKREQEILKLRNERLSEEVREKNAQLSAALLQSAHKNTSLDRLKKQLLEITHAPKADADQKKEIRHLVRKIDSELSSEDYWEQFQLNFDQVHQQFSQLLHIRHPKLSPNEIRLSCLLRINMTNREIASIQNISLSAVEKSKYRLKKKLGLKKEADLNSYILSLS